MNGKIPNAGRNVNSKSKPRKGITPRTPVTPAADAKPTEDAKPSAEDSKAKIRPKKLKEATHEELTKLNKAFAVVNESGDTLVIHEKTDIDGRRVVERWSEQALYRYLAHERRIENRRDGSKRKRELGLGEVWFKWEQRRNLKGVKFDPSDKLDKEHYVNLWQGFSVEPKPGDWSLFEEHIRENICDSKPELYFYVMAWLAQGVQHPEQRPEVALILRSEERGTGKSLFARHYSRLFGQHGQTIADPRHVFGQFNAHLEDCIVLVLEEAAIPRYRAGEGILKSLITEDTISIEGKGQKIRKAANYLRIIMTSNDTWVVPAGIDERRYLVLDVNPQHKQDRAYFAAIEAQMANGGQAAMLHELRHWDCSDIDLRTAPQTEALAEQKLLSLDPLDSWMLERLQDGTLFEGKGWNCEIPKDQLTRDYIRHLETRGLSRKPGSPAVELGVYLHKLFGSNLKETRQLYDGIRQRCFRFPTLARSRELFVNRVGPIKWPAEREKQIISHKRASVVPISRGVAREG